MDDRAAAVLDRLRAPEPHSRVFILGTLESRVAFAAQQLRAFNLVWALVKEGVVDRRTGRVTIVGAGVGGMTTAVACKATGLSADMFEARAFFGGGNQTTNRQRYVHPNIMDWPRTGALGGEAHKLPYLKWRAGLAADVLKQITSQVDQYISRLSQNQVKCRPVERIEPIEDGVIVRLPHSSSKYDAVILSVGFGVDLGIDGTEATSYWGTDTLDDIKSPPQRWLVVGTGDGGLIDTLRLSIRNFQHGEFTEAFTNTGRHPQLEQRLLAIEEKARELYNQGLDETEYIVNQYKELVTAGVLTPEMRQIVVENLRGDVRVTLYGRRKHPFGVNSSIFHRVAVYLLYDQLDYMNKDVHSRGDLEPFVSQPDFGGCVVRRGQERIEKLLDLLGGDRRWRTEVKSQLEKRVRTNAASEDPSAVEPLWGGDWYSDKLPPVGKGPIPLNITMAWTILVSRRSEIAVVNSLSTGTLGTPVAPAVRTAVHRLFPVLNDVWISTGNVSPAGDIPSLTEFQRWYLQEFGGGRPLVDRDVIVDEDLSGNLCSIGGPFDARWTRYALGYGSEDGEFIRKRPRYVFDLAKTVANRNRVIVHSTKEDRRYEVSDWALWDRKEDKEVPAPERTQYLVVSLLPNTLASEARDKKTSLLVIAAAHAQSQAAVVGLFQSELMITLQERVGSSRYFSALFLVEIERDEGGIDVPTGRVKLVDVERFDAAAFADWPTLDDWYTEGRRSLMG